MAGEYLDAAELNYWKQKNQYYHSKLKVYFKSLIPEGSSVLEVGCRDGDLLAALKPTRGVGIEENPHFIAVAQKKYLNLEFHSGSPEFFHLKSHEPFEFIILSNVIGYLDDILKALENLIPYCSPYTRIILGFNNYLWEPILKLGSRFGYRRHEPVQNWISPNDLKNMLHLSRLETVSVMTKILFPLRIPLLSWLMNNVLVNLPLINRLGLNYFLTARLKPCEREDKLSVSVVIPCRNEKGNIQGLIERMPVFPPQSEIIFVDGHSTDGTPEEIESFKERYPEKNIRLIQQDKNQGKGAAVRQGFSQAKGEVLMILDADLSLDPEELTRFYSLIKSRTGELISGCRMVYPMEREAMRFLNAIGNKCFSLFFSYLINQSIKDTLCGTKVLYRSDYEKIAKNRAFFGELDPFGDFDLLLGAAKLNMKITELPVRYHRRKYGETKTKRFHHGLLLTRMCLTAMKKLKFT